jgi:hypothetical protein
MAWNCNKFSFLAVGNDFPQRNREHSCLRQARVDILSKPACKNDLLQAISRAELVDAQIRQSNAELAALDQSLNAASALATSPGSARILTSGRRIKSAAEYLARFLLRLAAKSDLIYIN